MKKILIALTFAISLCAAQAQDPPALPPAADSIIALLPELQGEEKLEALRGIISRIGHYSPQTKHYARLYLEEAIRQNNSVKIGDAYGFLISGYWDDYLKDVDSFFIVAEEGIRVTRQHQQYDIMFHLKLNTILRHRQAGNYFTALRVAEEAYKEATNLQLPGPMASVLFATASIYSYLQQHEEALRYFIESLEWTEKNPNKGNRQTFVNTYLQMANRVIELERPLEAIRYLDSMRSELEHILRDNPDNETAKMMHLYLYPNYAEAYILLNRPDRALHYIRQAEAVYQPHWGDAGSIFDPVYLKYYMAIGNYDKALDYGKRILDSDEDPNYTIRAKKIMAEAYFKKGNYKAAYELLKDAWDRRTTFFSEQSLAQLNEFRSIYELDKTELELTKTQMEKQRMFWVSISVGALFLLALALFFFYWRWSIQKRRLGEKQAQLVATQAELDGEVKERKRLARDLHDGLGGLLSVAKLHTAKLRKVLDLTDEIALDYDRISRTLDDCEVEMRFVAHHLMPDTLSNFGLKQALTDFCKPISIAKFQYVGNEQRLDNKMEISIYHIAHELINNSLKHAEATEIFVQLAQEDDLIVLTVEDNGKGFEPANVVSGTGLANVRTRVDLLGGKFYLNSSVGNGMEANVEIGLGKER